MNIDGPLVYADNVTLSHNRITNGHTGSCVIVDRYGDAKAPTGVVIEDNQIYSCGRLPATNHDQGIYLDHARDAKVRGNWISDTADRGIQMYPDAQRSTVVRNVIDANGQGVSFGGTFRVASHNVVRRNVISNSVVRWNVESSWAGAIGEGNVLSSNCLWASPDGQYSGTPTNSGVSDDRAGFTIRSVTVAEPEFANRAASNFRLLPGSQCARAVGWTDSRASSAGSAPAR